MNSFILQRFANDACGEAIDNKTCWKTEYHFRFIAFDRDFHCVLLHKDLYGVAVGAFHFHQIADNTLFYKLQNFA